MPCVVLSLSLLPGPSLPVQAENLVVDEAFAEGEGVVREEAAQA